MREAYWLSDAARWAYYSDTTKHAPYQGGPQYHGRGFIQTTHIYNYQRVQDETGLPVVANPDLLLTDPQAAAEAFAIYWQDRGIAAMAERQDWAAVRRAVLGAAPAENVAKIQRVASYLLPRVRA